MSPSIQCFKRVERGRGVRYYFLRALTSGHTIIIRNILLCLGFMAQIRW